MLGRLYNGSAFVRQANHETMKNMEAKKLNKTNHEQGACQHETLVIPPFNEVFLMDCMEGMKQYPDKFFDIAIVDPPYRDSSENDANKSMRKHIKKGRLKDWKNKPGRIFFKELFRVSKNQIIWGANNYELPSHKGFVIWRKPTIPEKFTMSMCEMAYISEGLSTISKVVEFSPNIYNRIHPTQKPVRLYEWLLTNYANEGDKILDTHVGSGSSRIACHKMGFDFTGYEIDEDYWNAQEQRFKEFKKQLTLF